MNVIVELAKAVGGIAVILGAWIAVQGAWRRTFPGTPRDEDVLAGRLGCHGDGHSCGCETTCERRGGGASPASPTR